MSGVAEGRPYERDCSPLQSSPLRNPLCVDGPPSPAPDAAEPGMVSAVNGMSGERVGCAYP